MELMRITGSRHSDMHAQPKTPSFSLLNPHLVIHAIVSPARDNIHILPHFQFLLMIVNDNFLRRCGPRCAGIDMSHCVMFVRVPCMRHSCMNSVWTRCMHARGEGGGSVCIRLLSCYCLIWEFDLRLADHTSMRGTSGQSCLSVVISCPLIGWTSTGVCPTKMTHGSKIKCH